MVDYYCHDNDGYSMQRDDYNFMQMQDDYHHSPHAGIPISMKPPSPPPQYSKRNMMMWSGNYSTHQDGFPGKNNYSNACYGQSMRQGYSGSSGGTDGYYIMSHAAMSGKPPSHHTMSASQFTHGGGGGGGDGGGGGYNSIIASSSSYPYDYYNYNNKIGRPNTMLDAFVDYDRGNWGNTSTGYHYNNGQIVNCINNQIVNGMPYDYNKKDDQWRTKNLA